MFWRFGGYANISTIDTILDKNDFTLEELLDEGDLIQELKQHNAKLIDYLRDEPVLVRLLEYVVAPRLEPVATPDPQDDEAKEGEPETEKGKGRVLPFSRPRASSRASEPENKEEEMEKKRNRYAYVAAEILASDNWSICEALLANKTMLRNFWEFLRHPIPLDPLQASYFTKVNEALFDKKTEEMIELLKSIDNAVPDMLRHVDCPMIMDLLLKIISLERTEAGQGIWLYTQDVMPTLLSFLGPEHSWATQTSAGDFMKAIITVSANASQNEQTCIGPNELTRQLVSKDCVEKLISYMLGGGNALTVGVGIVIEVIRKNNSDYDPDVGAEASSSPSSRDPIYLGTLLRLFAEHVPDFAHLIMNAPAQKARLESTFGDKIEPLGFDRFKTCELMAELLHCSNMGLLNEVGSEELIAARDSERQRLRVEGKLSALRGEDVPSSADDLTMRISHSSPVDEGRRLEITNISEDDGFEEVAHSKEMTEDTSHEFVKAEEEIQAGQATSFLDKDEDDFVDEPLSSPQLQASDAKIEEPDFDDPDLVVAPLSPSKQKVGDPNELPPSPSKDEGTEVEDLVEDMQKSLLEDKPKTPEPQGAAGPADDSDTATPAVDTPAALSVADSVTTNTEAQGPLQPEAEASSSEPQLEAADTPAPLFSQQQPASKEDAAKTEEPKEADASDALKQAEEPQDASQAAEPDQSGHAETAGDASILVGHELQPEAQDLSNVQPVVGDYLKMQFVEYGIVPTILSFFFKYPWNNFLHNVVYDIVQQVFNGPMDRGFNPTLAISLFESADITSQIINGQQASEQSQQQNRTRMGYMGHLTLIAEEVVKFTERHPPELLSETVLQRVMDQEWINYVEGALAETRERDNAILGGVRPEVAMSNRQAGGLSAVGLSSLGAAFGSSQGGSSNALADAGLNGGLNDVNDNGGGNGIGPFAISSGTLMSGFGSSSDEDEDEEAENEEDVNNEVGILPFAPSQPRPRRLSGLSSFAGRPVPRLFTRTASGFYGSENCIEDSDSDDPERSCPDLDDGHDHDSADEDELEPRKMSPTRIAPPPLARGTHRVTLAEPMDDFEDVSLADESDSNSLGHLSPDEWEDVEDQNPGRTDVDLTGPVQQVDDGVMEQETYAIDQADDDSDPLFSLLISVNFPSEEEMQPRRARRDEEIHRGMLDLVRELFDGKYPGTFLERMADILSCPPGNPPSEHDMRVQTCLVEIGRLVQKSAPPEETTNPRAQPDKLMAGEEEC
ncbi:SIT4 phosphatase-associated protein [Diaporthe helianthi]|uniref:SIT4 phosphatase-associated protein n=1 Tax=Diaporthe helianthi TaxID=158607 RepID=A0A2P5HX26_DIAHE|nr:SIT4 phosphatase-associated protein [Diaporthe helianthi]